MTVDGVWTGADRRLRRARQVTLVFLVTSVWASLLLPGAGLTREPDPTRVTLGAVAVLGFTVAQTSVLYAAVTPGLSHRWRRRFTVGLAVTAVLSVPLAGPVAAGTWPTWAWLGASLVGMAPLVLATPGALVASAAVVAVSAGVARWTGGSLTDHLIITGLVGAGVATVNRAQVWFWDLLVEARQGEQARARLAAAEERLRFARDVHDLLGHDLTVIALKAELAARLAPVDAARAGREADEVRRLAGTALHRVREAVHDYRAVDLTEQLTAVGEVLRSCGVRCTVRSPDGELPARAAADLAAVLREAGTNVLRHSRAGWCRIDVEREDDMITMTVRNDGAAAGAPDEHSHGLRGLAERLAAGGGGLAAGRDGDEFVLRARVPVTP
ncbi:histidine kinase [Micromonospora sp. PLK6-60]|uniref:sensor histidine kinase n=1 Tax=Micromonospora sp. PLK6-60 TaxID=2873383 RepID=UPI001CA74217|nr:histidine kinase [Micromonospora sp. PLK6-60]MBY8874314.1 histidine kinase [Micromonospora sp. PLK6-60]